MYRQRTLRFALQEARSGFPAILLTGPRQSGKTTFLRHELGQETRLVSFDDPLEREFALSDPHGFLNQFKGQTVILDEIQYVPSLLQYIKMHIDQGPEDYGKWLLTGSQQFGLMRDVSESLAGRVAILELPPFSHAEYPRNNLAETLWHGGYPIPALHPDRRDLWLRAYIATYLERDVRQIRNIPDLRIFSQYLNLLAARHGQTFQAAELARELGVSQPTIKSWASVLEASYILHFLAPWFRNYGKRVVKTPKLYFYDTALVQFLTRQPDALSSLAGPMAGQLMEGWVVTEAVKAFLSRGYKPDLYFWRSHDGLEVDLLLVIHGKLQAIEIKLTSTPNAGHTEPMNRFIALAGDEAVQTGIVVCQTEKPRALPHGHLAMPWQQFPSWLAEHLSTSSKK